MAQNNKKHSVICIGAGPAGLTAAYRLVAEGADAFGAPGRGDASVIVWATAFSHAQRK